VLFCVGRQLAVAGTPQCSLEIEEVVTVKLDIRLSRILASLAILRENGLKLF